MKNLKIFRLTAHILFFVSVFSCNTFDEGTLKNEIKEQSYPTDNLRQWYDANVENHPSLTKSKNLRHDKRLQFEFNQIKVDWSTQEKYNFPDGRNVYELNFQSVKPIFPSEFLDHFEFHPANYFSEKILFIESSENNFEIILTRFYTLDDKQSGVLKNATYQSIPKDWTGRLDVFTYGETHLISYIFQEGSLKSTIEYSMEGETGKQINNFNKLVVCSGTWVIKPYWMGIEAVYEINCQIIPDSGGYVAPPTNNLGLPYNSDLSYGGGYIPQGGGGGGNSGVGCTPTDNTNYFQDPNNCIPAPNWEDPEARRLLQLNYLRTHGASAFVNLIEEMLSTPGIKVGDVWEINLLVNQVYERQIGMFMMAIFSPENIALFLGNLFANPNLTNNVRNNSFRLFSTYSNSISQPIYKSFIGSNFRHNLIQRTGFNPSTAQAHHAFPQASEFSAFFTSKGLNVHNPSYGAWWPTSSHQINASAYNQMWRQWISANPGATQLEVLEFGRQVMAYFKIAILF